MEIKELFVVTYPFVMLLYGLVALFRRQFGWGAFVLVFSSLLIMDRFDLFVFDFLDVWKLWPLLLIYFGFAMIFKKK
ncbi:DUF5668 domain-containing protein [Mesobacillus subterraneus]|uniref:LiaF transmembrane domain-containing protein n=1 Tax=Mesobacillus subterraneus TaxID=285983 RepID=UPI0027402DCC|nr:DUF5668 domain-containing protein [Mesobacillus subterraneus]WLR53950.1 DUF5668 domain-containing protein [Mesobacillus subterraneus]